MTPAQKYRATHPDRVRETTRKYRETHSEKIKEAQKKYRTLYPDRIKETQRKHKEKQNSPRSFLEKKLQRVKRKEKTCRASAQHKFQKCDLTIDYVMNIWSKQNGRCALTNKKMTHQFNCLFSASIDRINSEEGYVQGNIQLLCLGVNYAKSKFTNEEFLTFWGQEEK